MSNTTKTNKRGLWFAACALALCASGYFAGRTFAGPATGPNENLSFAGVLSGVTWAPAPKLQFTFHRGTTSCAPPAVTVTRDDPASDAFHVDIPISVCAGFFDGSAVTVDIEYNNTVLVNAQSVAPVPYAKYADEAGHAKAADNATSAANATGALATQLDAFKDRDNWRIEAYVNGGGNMGDAYNHHLPMTASAFPDNPYVPYAASYALQTITDPSHGHLAAARLACKGKLAVDPDATTHVSQCSSSDGTLGINFDQPFEGRFQVCVDYSLSFQVAPGGDAEVLTALGETLETTTPPIATTDNLDIPLRASKEFFRVGSGASSASNSTRANTLCRAFSWPTTGRRTVRLMFFVTSVTATGTVDVSVDTPNEQAARWTVETLDRY